MLKNIGIGICLVITITTVPTFFAWLAYVVADAFLAYFQRQPMTQLANQFRWYAATFCAGAVWMALVIMFALVFNDIFDEERA